MEISANSRGKADEVVEFVRAGTEESEGVTRVLFKRGEAPKYKPKQVVAMMVAEGFPRFSMTAHSTLGRIWGLGIQNGSSGGTQG